ncbi:CHAT domain-containing tetratricopeptide repeat protein [Cyanobium gracile]|uniref:CHAT domain-containing tetratricopeptide repeat protein n=1 Tax=Cyanobium gracile UHCC 0281 TaxID=3110309 RepID=A0ABU5SV89_9CYAN|nr:CHAT domain-containing tetratricopeptide repeat protein [Cyanobium gracile]MEA5442277.1 CHAT domain-containing tetratricopeptide repeat protein [Cyanobium gracile UHCC 0281]
MSRSASGWRSPAEAWLVAGVLAFCAPAGAAEMARRDHSHQSPNEFQVSGKNVAQMGIDSQELSQVEAWVMKAEELKARRDYGQAIPLMKKILAWREKTLGAEHPGTVLTLNDLGILYINQEDYQEAELFLKRALAIREKTLHPEHLHTALSLYNLGFVYNKQSLYVQAEPLYRRALAIREKALGHEHPDAVLTLNDLGILYANQGDYGKAEPLLKRALAIREKTLHPEHLHTALSLDNLAFVYNKQSLYVQAEPLYRRALAIREKSLGPKHPDLANSLNKLGDFYVRQLRYQEAEPLYMRALTIQEISTDSNPRQMGLGLAKLALLYERQGRHAEAESLFRRSLAIAEKSQGHDQRLIAISLSNLASVLASQGRYGEAEPLYQRSLAIREKTLGAEHIDTSKSLNNLASLYVKQGRNAEAAPLFRRALSINEKVLGTEHADTGTILSNLAYLNNEQDRFGEVEPLLKRALAIQEKSLVAEHPDIARNLNNLGTFYFGQGRYGEAEPLIRRALAIREKMLGPDHPDTATSLNNLASLYRKQSRFIDAEPLYKRALVILENRLGGEHPSTATIIDSLALLHLNQKDYPSARALLSRVSRTQANWLVRELPLQPRELRGGLLAEQSDAPATIYALLDQDPGARELALQTRLNRQGLLAEIEQRQQRLAASGPQTRELADRIGAIDRQLASVSLPADRRPELQKQRLQLEGDLYRSLPNLRIEAVSTAQVAAALPRKGALVEFQRYRPWQVAAGGKGSWGPPRYVALVLQADGRSVSVPLGEAAGIDAAVAKAHGATAKNEVDPAPLWAEVSRLVLDPLQAQLGGVEDLFLSPDGELHRIPFAVLPAGKDRQRLLSEAVRLRVVTTGRDLVRLQQPPKAGGSPVVMANPAYGVAAGTAGAGAGGTQGGQQRSSALRGGLTWDPLPATKAEATQVATLLGAGAPIVAEQATAARALQQKGPLIFHIATHGFFFPAPEPEERKGEGAARGLGVAEDPLLRSGLVLSGANAPERNPADDGYLTAAEATGMDLEGTELVVLSACETGLGDVRSGEGVYGLQRAFTVAGSRATLLSLWKVDDAATAAFMAAYYGRLRQGEGRAEALTATQADFRRHADPLYRDAYVWGAFQLTGDWRPIERLGSGKGRK